jgi:flagellin
MAISILNNIPSLAAQNQLSITQASLQKTLYALSSGSRINSGADDAAGLAIADGLHANITALTQSARNANDGVGKLQVADGALSQVTTLLNHAVTLATESATGTLDSAGNQRAALNAEFTAIKAEIDRIGTNTTYNGAAIFQGGSANYSQAVISDATVGGLGMSTAVTGQLLLKGGTGPTAFTFTSSASDATVGDLINDINKNSGGLIASLDTKGNLVVTDTKNRGVDVTSELQDNTSTLKVGGDAALATVTAAPTNASSMDVYLSDSTGVGSSTISVALNQFDSGRMNGASIANDDLLSAATAQTALTDINNAIARVASLRGDIGAGINRLQSATSVMNNQTQNLSAAEDGVRSADITQEVANLTKFQILSQTGISALAQANQMQQSVLKLLQ